MKKIIALLVLFIVAGCVTNESSLKNALRKNPKIIFDVIEENPEQFMESVSRAAQAARLKEREQRMAKAKDLRPELTPDRRLLGDDKGKIVIVEYADFQCPACRMAYESLLAFKKKHAGQVQFYFKNMPLSFHQQAMPAAQYLEAIRLQGRDKAYKFYEYVFQRQNKLTSKGFLDEAAKAAGADLARLKKDLESDAVKKAIAADMSEFERFGFTGTPTLLVNGTPFMGAPSMEELERAIQR